jgi:microcystin-dependent protein
MGDNMNKLSSVALAALIGLTAGLPGQVRAQDCIISEVRTFATNFCPRGWTEADGHLVSISSNTSLFSLLGTMYGGDGRTNFAVPDLRGRSVVGRGQGRGLEPLQQGWMHGYETSTFNGIGLSVATDSGGTPIVALSPSALTIDNRPPYTVLLNCICANGMFPQRD